MTFATFFPSIMIGLLMVVAVLAVIKVGRLVSDAVTRTLDETKEILNNNLATGISRAGYFTGMFIACSSLVLNNHKIDDLPAVIGWALVSVIMMIVARLLNDHFILGTVDNQKRCAEGCIATGIVEAASYIATGIIIYGCMQGTSTASVAATVVAAAIFFSLGQINLILGAQLLAKDDINIIETWNDQNARIVAGINLGARIIALGFVIKAAVAGDFTGYKSGIGGFCVTFITGFVLVWLISVLTNNSCFDKANKATNIANAVVCAVPMIAISALVSLIF
jgi:hypothetical protein